MAPVVAGDGLSRGGTTFMIESIFSFLFSIYLFLYFLLSFLSLFFHHIFSSFLLFTDYGHQPKTTGSIRSQGPWETLSVDIVGPLPVDRRKEFLIVFVDCFSKFTILVPASDHTASTVSEALLLHVIPYFGTPRQLLSDRGREFVSAIWTQLLPALGIHQILTSPYHPEGNAINEWSHSTLNNLLRARLLEGPSTKAWVDKIPGIMLTLNSMPHGYSASMIATGRETTLPPDLHTGASPSFVTDDVQEYVEKIRRRLQMTQQQLTPEEVPPRPNPYKEGSLIYVLVTPPERISKLVPRWKGPFCVARVPNAYQVVHDDEGIERTVHVNHVKPAKLAAPDLPPAVAPPKPVPPPVGYWPSNLTHALRTPADVPPAPVVPNAASNPAPMPPVAPPCRSARLQQRQDQPSNACAVAVTRTQPRGHQSEPRAHTANIPLGPRPAPQASMDPPRPRTASYSQVIGPTHTPLSFGKISLVDLETNKGRNLTTLRHLKRALPHTTKENTRFALAGNVVRPGDWRLRRSFRDSLWALLPSDGEFVLEPRNGQYFLERRGRRLILRGGDVKEEKSRDSLNWIEDHVGQSKHQEGERRERIFPTNNRSHGKVCLEGKQMSPESSVTKRKQMREEEIGHGSNSHLRRPRVETTTSPSPRPTASPQAIP